MIVDCAIYRDGVRVGGTRDPVEAIAVAREDGGFVWLGLLEPTVEEFDRVADAFGLHELAIEDAVKAHQRPKLERYGETVFLVLKTARYVDEVEVVEIDEIQLFVDPLFVVSIRHGEASDLHPVRERLEGRPDLLRHGPRRPLRHPRRGRGRLRAGRRGRRQRHPRRRGAGLLGRARESGAAHLRPGARGARLPRAPSRRWRPIDRLAPGRIDVPEELRTYFRDIADHIVRVLVQIDSHRELLTNALQANLTQTSVRQNEDVRKISAYAAMLAVPPS